MPDFNWNLRDDNHMHYKCRTYRTYNWQFTFSFAPPPVKGWWVQLLLNLATKTFMVDCLYILWSSLLKQLSWDRESVNTLTKNQKLNKSGGFLKFSIESNRIKRLLTGSAYPAFNNSNNCNSNSNNSNNIPVYSIHQFISSSVHQFINSSKSI